MSCSFCYSWRVLARPKNRLLFISGVTAQLASSSLLPTSRWVTDIWTIHVSPAELPRRSRRWRGSVSWWQFWPPLYSYFYVMDLLYSPFVCHSVLVLFPKLPWFFNREVGVQVSPYGGVLMLRKGISTWQSHVLFFGFCYVRDKVGERKKLYIISPGLKLSGEASVILNHPSDFFNMGKLFNVGKLLKIEPQIFFFLYSFVGIVVSKSQAPLWSL